MRKPPQPTDDEYLEMEQLMNSRRFRPVTPKELTRFTALRSKSNRWLAWEQEQERIQKQKESEQNAATEEEYEEWRELFCLSKAGKRIGKDGRVRLRALSVKVRDLVQSVLNK